MLPISDRRNRQRAYLERLEQTMTEEPPESSSRFATDIDVSQTDIRRLVRAQLQAIQSDAEQAVSGANDLMTRAHLADLAERTHTVLENGIKGLRVIDRN